MKKALLPLMLVVISICAGCSSEATATKEDEKNFRNPPKFPPSQAVPGGAPPSSKK